MIDMTDMTNNKNLPCSVIEDLIPLCRENLCSEESRIIVEEHIKGCESCRALYENVEIPQVAGLSDQDEKKPFKKVNSRLKRSRIKIIILSLLLAVTVLPLVYLAAGQMLRWDGAVSFDTIVQNIEARRMADAFAGGDIDLFADYLAYESESSEGSFLDNIESITENDKKNLKELYLKAFDGLPAQVTEVRTVYNTGEPESHITVDFRDLSVEDRYVGHTVSFRLRKTYYGKYTGYISGLSYDPDTEKEGADGKPDSDFGDFVRCFDLIAHHDINRYNSLEAFIASDDPLGAYDTGGSSWVMNDDGTQTEIPSVYDPAITYLGQYFVPEDREHIVQSMVSFLEKGNLIINCSVSDPCYDADRQMLYYIVMITAAQKDDSHGHAVLQARMFYDYRGIYQPEVFSVAPNGCTPELAQDLWHFFGYELLEPVLTSKTDDLTGAKALLDEQGIRCKIAIGTDIDTGEHDYNLLTSEEDAPAAGGILAEIYGENSEYDCYIY